MKKVSEYSQLAPILPPLAILLGLLLALGVLAPYVVRAETSSSAQDPAPVFLPSSNGMTNTS